MMIPPFFQRRASSLGIVIILSIVLLITFMHTLGQWHHDWQLAHQEALLADNPSSAAEKTIALIAALPQKHLFGEHRSLAKIGEIPITNLQLRVTGIIKLNTEKNGPGSKAMIAIAGEPSKIYQVGDKLPVGGVKLYAITPDAIVLDNGKHLEKLPLPRQPLQFRPRNSKEPI